MASLGKKTESRFVAVTADVVASRQVPDRAGLQRRLLAALPRIGEALGRRLAADVQLTAGDEVQALVRAPEAAMAILQQLSDAVHPTQLRFGVGVGALDTPLPSRRAARKLPLLDGSCFHRARAALDEARALNAWAAADGFGPWQQPLNALLELIGNLRQQWTEKQGQYAAAARESAQKDVARRYGVSPSVISESLKSARLDLLQRGEQGVVALLQHFADSADEPVNSADAPNPRPARPGPARKRSGARRSGR